MTLQEAISQRIMVLDGAMGTILPWNGNPEMLNLTAPEIIRDIHEKYISAGADIIETNSFSANPISQDEHGCAPKAGEMALRAAQIARSAADNAPRKVWVAGSVGPTTRSLTMAQDAHRPAFRPFSFDDAVEAFRVQIEGLVKGGVDCLLLETGFDALNTKAMIYAASRWEVPIIVSASVSDRSWRTLIGQTLEAFFCAIRHARLLAFGINCSLGPGEMKPLLEDIARFSDLPIICYPNAGLPNELGRYTLSPGEMARQMEPLLPLINIVGGCCGTTPEHIRAIAEKAAGMRPRPVPPISKKLRVSGLEAVRISRENNFTNIGERTNVAGSRKFARLISEGRYEEALQIAALQIDGGARIIDINMDDAMLDAPKEMEVFLRHVSTDPAVARAAIMIDSSNWDAVLSGLKNAPGKCIVNSISLKEGEQVFLEKALEIRRLGAAFIVMAFDEKGQATTLERKIEICRRSYELLTAAGIEPWNIIFDCNVLSVGTGIPEHARYGIDFIDAVRWIKQNLPGCYTSGGISNLSFAFRGNNGVREAMHAVFLYHAVQAGLDMGIVNPGMLLPYDAINEELRQACEDVILCKGADASSRLLALASSIAQSGQGSEGKELQTPSGSPRERILHCLLQGRSEGLEDAVLECLKAEKSAVKVVEGPLMQAMEEVGLRFGEGKMFLPQVVRAAKVMKEAVSILEPHFPIGSEASDKPKIIVATVKGDVHDIGKNIMGIVLSCNGFQVVDLGVMVDKETILERALEEGAAAIAVSGLITPSLFQMEELCREMSARGVDLPLFVGGATTSALHTAVKLAPLYPHVFHGADASVSAVLIKRCLGSRDSFEKSQHQAQKALRVAYESKKRESAATKEVTGGHLSGCPFRSMPVRTVPLKSLKKHFDWKLFAAAAGLKKIPRPGTPGYEFLLQGRNILEHLEAEVRVGMRLCPARRENNTIVLSGSKRLPMLRQEGGLSLADFVPSEGSGPFGVFAISVHSSAVCTCPDCDNPILRHAVVVTLADAASAWLQKNLQRRAGTKVLLPAAGYACCPDLSIIGEVLPLIPGHEKLGISLTESFAMIPDASICGFVIIHPQAQYPEIRKISASQYESYRKERGLTPREATQFLGHISPNPGPGARNCPASTPLRRRQ